MARRRRGFVRGPRRAVDWSASSVLAAPVTVPGASAVLIETFQPIAGGETVIRTRGMLGWESDQTAATERQIGAFGICVVTQQATTVGITAIPHPATDAAWGGWLYHTFFFSEFRLTTAAGFESNFLNSMVIDSKAMRKVDEDERLVVVVENTHATQSFLFFNSERFLTKVH